MDNKTSFPQFFTDLIVSMLAGIFIIGTALSILWGWYVTRIFGIRAISLGEAYGLLLLMSSFTGGLGRLRSHIESQDRFGVLEKNLAALCKRSGFTAISLPARSWDIKLAVRVGTMLLWAIMLVLTGWIVKFFI